MSVKELSLLFKNQTIHVVDGLTSTASGIYSRAKAMGFDGSLQVIRDRLRAGNKTMAELAAPVSITNLTDRATKARGERAAASKDECAAAMAAVDARRREIAMAADSEGDDE